MAFRHPLFAHSHFGEMTGALSEQLGHRFQDETLLRRALTHAGADAARSNERLEFLGDRVLALVVAEELYRRYAARMKAR